MNSNIIKQFGNPSGMFGSFVGWLMTIKNTKRIKWAVELMDVQPNDTILEIGFGPGVAIKLMAEYITTGKIIGIDRSELMVKKAIKRNKKKILENKVELNKARTIPSGDNSILFDKVLAINVSLFWREPEKEMGLIKGCIKPGGFLQIILQPHWAKTEEHVQNIAYKIARQLKNANYKNIELKFKMIKKLSCIAIKAYN